MAVNSDTTNKLYSVNDTSVKFFSSLTRAQAKGTESFVYEGKECTISDFPGAICYVSDTSGNSIFLNKLLFGDGATAGSISGGGSSGGITEVTLDMIPVIELNGTTLKTLADYFNSDGDFISEGLNIYYNTTDSVGDTYLLSIFKVNSDGIFIGDVSLDTYLSEKISAATPDILSQAQTSINSALEEAKNYTNSKLSSVYSYKGSVVSYSALLQISNPEDGWVYNVTSAYKPDTNSELVYPAGTNYAYVAVSSTADSRYPGYWDPLGGLVDLSSYRTSSLITSEILESLATAKDYSDTKVSELKISVDANTLQINIISQSISSILSTQESNSAKIASNTEAIEQNTTNITNISTQLTWQ